MTKDIETTGTTVILTEGHGFEAGDTIVFTMPDKRLLKRLLNFITGRKPPVILEKYKITNVMGDCISI